MNLKKAETLFKRAWEKATVGQIVPTVVDISAASANPLHDGLVISFDAPITPSLSELVEKTGCVVIDYLGTSMTVSPPIRWLAAPSRLMLPSSPQDELHNALLDAGVADWLDIRSAPDDVALLVEFLTHPVAEQIAALKTRYDVLTFEDLTYTLVERTSVIEQTATLLVDPAAVEDRLRAAWGGARAGKILTVEATDNPRRWMVTARKTIPNNAQFSGHGLKQIELWASENRALIELGDAIWLELLEAAKPAPSLPPTIEAPELVEAEPTPAVTPDPAPELDERDLEIADLKAQTTQLRDIIRAMTPISNEWQTLRLTLNKDGKTIQHPEIGEQERLGWRVYSSQYAPNGEDRLLVLMERRPHTPRRMLLNAEAEAFPLRWERIPENSNINGRTTVITPAPTNSRADQMIEEMNAEIAPTARQLMNDLLRLGDE